MNDAADYSFGQIIYLPGSFRSFSYYLHTIATLSVVVPIKKKERKKEVILMYSVFKTKDIDGRAECGCAN